MEGLESLRKGQEKADALLSAVKNRGKIRDSYPKKLRESEDVHHLIDINALEDSPLILEAVADGFDINNGAINGIPLEGSRKGNPGGFHGNSASYSKYITDNVDGWAKEFEKKNGKKPTGTDTKKYLEGTLIPQARKEVEKAYKEWKDAGGRKSSGKNLNSYFKKLITTIKPSPRA
ncbi:MAG: hypothetical protein IPN76_03260 [Saprospiraceae bacterium]|nr:hypothetical protein [Saprospiraceae bacterium]